MSKKKVDLKAKLKEKEDELNTLRRYYEFAQASLEGIKDQLERAEVGSTVTVNLKGGIYHTFYKVKVNHPDY